MPHHARRVTTRLLGNASQRIAALSSVSDPHQHRRSRSLAPKSGCHTIPKISRQGSGHLPSTMASGYRASPGRWHSRLDGGSHDHNRSPPSSGIICCPNLSSASIPTLGVRAPSCTTFCVDTATRNARNLARRMAHGSFPPRPLPSGKITRYRRPLHLHVHSHLRILHCAPPEPCPERKCLQ